MEVNEFDDLIKMGRTTRIVNMGERKITMHTLDSDEYSAVMGHVPDDSKLTQAQKMEAIQRWTVIMSADTIDGKRVALETRELIFSKGQMGFSNAMYDEYVLMVEEQEKTLSDAKKNSSLQATSST